VWTTPYVFLDCTSIGSKIESCSDQNTMAKRSKQQVRGNDYLEDQSSDDDESGSNDDEEDDPVVAKLMAEVRRLRKKIRVESSTSSKKSCGVDESSAPLKSVDIHSKVSSEVTDLSGMSKYVLDCERTGVMDTSDDLSQNAMKVTKVYGWSLFKMVTEDDYHPSTDFAKIIMRRSNKDPDHAETIIWWNTIKQSVTRQMQNCRSSATQSMKKEFLGTYSACFQSSSSTSYSSNDCGSILFQ
jgi:hypothetical protein